MLDKFYRAHKFARNNDLKGLISKKVDWDIIMEKEGFLNVYVSMKKGGMKYH